MKAIKELGWAGLLFLLVAVLLVAATWAVASDISQGYTFQPAEKNITSTKLNAIAGSATINTSFFTDKDSVSPASGDFLLIYDVSSADYRKITVGDLTTGNTDLISTQTQDDTPETNVFYLFYDPNTGLFGKSTLQSMVLTNASLIANRTNWTTPDRLSTFLLAWDSGTGEYSKLNRSNLLYQAFNFTTFTNLAAATAVSNADNLLLWDAANATNKILSIAGLVTNASTASTLTNGDFFLGYSTNSTNIAKFTALQVQAYVTNAANSPTLTNKLPQTFIGTNGMPTTGGAATFTHGLAGIPQLIRLSLVCTNNDAATSYVAGDEVDLGGAMSETVSSLAQYTSTATAVTVRFNSSSTFQLLDKSSGARTGVTSRNNFIVVCRAVYFP